MLEDRVLAFQPDVVLVVNSPRLEEWLVSHLLHVVAERIAIPYPGLDALVRETGVVALANRGVPVPFDSLRTLAGALGIETRMPWHEAERRLRLASDSIVQWTLGEIAGVTRAHGAVPVYVALDNVVDAPKYEVRALMHAERAEFLVFNLFDLWQDRDKAELRLGEWDNHPNAAGHRVVAEQLLALVQQHRLALRLHPATRDSALWSGGSR